MASKSSGRGLPALDGHQPRPQVVIRRVQRDGEAELLRPSGELQDSGHEPHRRDRDSTGAHSEPAVQDVQRAVHRLEVGQRLAHPHEHHVVDRAGPLGSREARRVPVLSRDLGGGELPAEAEVARRTEDAAESAARLRGEAERQSIGGRDQHRLDLLAVLQPPEVLHRSVPGAGDVSRLQRRERKLGAEGGAKLLGQRGGLVQRAGFPIEHPTAELLGSVRGLAPRLHRRSDPAREILRTESEKIGATRVGQDRMGRMIVGFGRHQSVRSSTAGSVVIIGAQARLALVVGPAGCRPSWVAGPSGCWSKRPEIYCEAFYLCVRHAFLPACQRVPCPG